MALRLVLLAETVRRQLVQAGAQYRTFFAWLLIVLRRWMGLMRVETGSGDCPSLKTIVFHVDLPLQCLTSVTQHPVQFWIQTHLPCSALP